MKVSALLVALLLLAGCRGEPVPRDYTNHPPGATHPADDASEAPSQATQTYLPEPSGSAEGTSGVYEPVPGVPADENPGTTTQAEQPAPPGSGT